MREDREMKRGVKRETERVKKTQNLNGFGAEDVDFDIWVGVGGFEVGFISGCSDVIAINRYLRQLSELEICKERKMGFSAFK